MCVSVFYIRAFQLVSLSLSIYLFLYSLSIYLRVCLVATLTDAGEVFTPLPPTRSLDNLALSLRFELRVVDFPNEIIRRSEPGQKELSKFLFSSLDHSFGFRRASDHGAPFRHFALPPNALFRTLTLDETVEKDCITLKLWCY